MKNKNMSIFLINGKKNICSYCKTNLVRKTKVIEMKEKKSRKTKLIEETIFYCQKCHLYYLSQELCCQLNKKHPGYYIDVALYKIQSDKTKKINNSNFENSKSIENFQKKSKTFDNTKTDELNDAINPQTTFLSKNTLNFPLLLSNTYSFYHNICPKCSSVLIKIEVNIPILKENGDFFHYYARELKYCYKCQKGYVDKRIIDSMLNTMNHSTYHTYNIKLANVITQYNKRNFQYQYIPTLDNDNAIFFPEHDYLPKINEPTSMMALNEQSFLGSMGYTVNKNNYTRRKILSNAVILYGKRKVADHINFLIETRKNQVGGKTKYANALKIWQKDLNFISELGSSLDENDNLR